MYRTQIADIGPTIKRGSAELAILTVLARQDLHGYEIAKHIEQRTRGVLRFNLASLYPMLYRMERRGWVKGSWRSSRSGRRRRYYHLMPTGKKKLTPLRAQWRLFFRALNRLTGTARA